VFWGETVLRLEQLTSPRVFCHWGAGERGRLRLAPKVPSICVCRASGSAALDGSWLPCDTGSVCSGRRWRERACADGVSSWM
jgi:hypothetical protein